MSKTEPSTKKVSSSTTSTRQQKQPSRMVLAFQLQSPLPPQPKVNVSLLLTSFNQVPKPMTLIPSLAAFLHSLLPIHSIVTIDCLFSFLSLLKCFQYNEMIATPSFLMSMFSVPFQHLESCGEAKKKKKKQKSYWSHGASIPTPPPRQGGALPNEL